MSDGWMGSHITNDDLVKQNRLSEEFTAEITEKPAADGSGHYTLVLVPKPDSPVVWGKIMLKIRADLVPLEMTYHEEDQSLVRTLSFHDVQEIQGQKIPMRVRVTPADKSGEFTEIVYEELILDVDLPANTFSLQALRR